MTTVAELAIEEYKERNVSFEPLYPAIVVRVLPKEHQTNSGLWLPDTKQNKPIYEGIVIRCYPPKRIKLDDGRWVTIESGLSPGDHILFPHWSGEPVPWLRNALKSTAVEDEEYRLIPARGLISFAGMRDSGEPFLILNYEKESLDQKLTLILDKMVGHNSIAAAIEQIKKEFDIFPKVLSSKTTSGDNREFDNK